MDAVHVTIVRGADGPVSASLPREELRRRFGPGPPGIVYAVVERGERDLIWFLLPLGFLAIGSVFVLMARRARLSGMIIVWFGR